MVFPTLDRRARAWRAAREAGFACFVSGGGGGDSEEKTDHIVGRLRGQEGGVDGRVEEGSVATPGPLPPHWPFLI